MRRWMTGAALAGVALLAAGCDGRLAVRGQVLAAPSCGAEAQTLGAPLAGARVAIECPRDTAPVILATTNETGLFDLLTAGSMGLDCALLVSHEGYVTQRFAVGDLCAVTSRFIDSTRCHAVAVHAELSPAR